MPYLMSCSASYVLCDWVALCLNLEPLFSHLQKGDYKIHITRLCRIKNYSLQESIGHNIPHIVGIA